MEELHERVRGFIAGLPPHVTLVGAAKTRTADEVRAAAEAGLRWVGHNYVQEAETMKDQLRGWEGAGELSWHLIGHLQRNKAKKAVAIFDMVETLDSLRLAEALERACAEAGRVMPVLIEVNTGEEGSKSGVAPSGALDLARAVARLGHLRLQGVMTMGPPSGDPEESRSYFRVARSLFEQIGALGLPAVEMRWLSMGMSDSWQVAVEEGANIVRVGTRLFGHRERAHPSG